MQAVAWELAAAAHHRGLHTAGDKREEMEVVYRSDLAPCLNCYPVIKSCYPLLLKRVRHRAVPRSDSFRVLGADAAPKKIQHDEQVEVNACLCRE